MVQQRSPQKSLFRSVVSNQPTNCESSLRASIPPVNAPDGIGEGLYKSVFSLGESQDEDNEIIGAAKKEVMRAFDSNRQIEIEIVDNAIAQ
jgi:hypothetical protein